MFDSVTLDVVIGLVFIYLLYSLLATTINEAIASVFALRARKLEKALTRMLNDGITSHYNLWHSIGDILERLKNWIKGLVNFLRFKPKVKAGQNQTLLESFYDHPGIKYLGENKIFNKPSYISPEFFTKAVIDVLKDKATTTDASAVQKIQEGINNISDVNETKKFIQSLFDDAKNDEEKFKTLLGDWFNETMSRTSGWYKRQSQVITLIIGLVLAVTFNVDTILIVGKLAKDKDAAAHLADMATNYVQIHKDTTGNLSEKHQLVADSLHKVANVQLNNDIKDAGTVIGLGWNLPNHVNDSIIENNALNSKTDSINCKRCLHKIKRGNNPLFVKKQSNYLMLTTLGKLRYVVCMTFSSSRRLLGYLITALAISLGGPFWFDLLNKIVQLRAGGKKPNEAKQDS